MSDACKAMSDFGLYDYAEKFSIATHVRILEP